MRISLLLISLALAAPALGGCVIVDVVERVHSGQVKRAFVESVDRQLLGALYDPAQHTTVGDIARSGYTVDSFTRDILALSRPLGWAGNPEELTLHDWDRTSGSEGDALSRAYIEVARSRGNQVQVHRPILAAHLIKVLPLDQRLASSAPLELRREAVMVEATPDGMPVSVLLRFRSVRNLIGSTELLHAVLYTGPYWSQQIEFRLSPYLMQSTWLRSY